MILFHSMYNTFHIPLNTKRFRRLTDIFIHVFMKTDKMPINYSIQFVAATTTYSQLFGISYEINTSTFYTELTNNYPTFYSNPKRSGRFQTLLFVDFNKKNCIFFKLVFNLHFFYRQNPKTPIRIFASTIYFQSVSLLFLSQMTITLWLFLTFWCNSFT